ncbi:MAG: Ig domain-containing protein, partial [Thermodesulfobacteriota bacterium]
RIDNPYLPTGILGNFYRAQLTASGGVPPYRWALTGYNALPAGLSLYASGEISGTPQTRYSGSVEFAVTDNQGTMVRATAALSVVDNTPPVRIGSFFLPEGREDRYYRASLYASGGIRPYTWRLTGNFFNNLPWGLSLSSDGEIYGTPRNPGNYSFEVEVKDAYGRTDRQRMRIDIRRRPMPPPPHPGPGPRPH